MILTGVRMRSVQTARLPSRNPVPVDEAQKPNDCWWLDFMSDSLTDGRSCRTLNVVDGFNPEGLTIEVDH